MMKAWLKLATVKEQEELAKLAGTSRQLLRQLAHADKTWGRNASADLAQRIAAASIGMRRSSKGRLPLLQVTDLSPACARCEFAKRCLGLRDEQQKEGVV